MEILLNFITTSHIPNVKSVSPSTLKNCEQVDTLNVKRYKEILNIIFEYYGKIKYKNGKYVNIIHKNDLRYDIIKPLIYKKIEILKDIQLVNSGFYFEFGFDFNNKIGLCYDYHFSYRDKFEICYYDWRDGIKQIRTFI